MESVPPITIEMPETVSDIGVVYLTMIYAIICQVVSHRVSVEKFKRYSCLSSYYPKNYKHHLLYKQ